MGSTVCMSDFTVQNYRISLTPDLSDFRFSGRIEVSGTSQEPTDSVRLHALELDISSCRVRIGGEWIRCTVEPESKSEQIEIRFPEKLSGDIGIEIEYRGVISDRMSGLYRSRYRVGEDTRYVAVTQFQESDARRAFPCQDHPVTKATFDVELIVDENLSAISNQVPEEEVLLGDGTKRVRFRRTPRMSTYLLFFGIGDFECVRSGNDSRVQVVTMPGMIRYADYGLDFGCKALGFCEDYFRIPYPLPKMDLIAIPDFAFGAMENWGAITFRENLLLRHPDITSRAGEERICEVIAHEIVHQWFGNLVTPADWKYLWLNESFATFFGYGVVDHHHPEWGVWEHFLVGQTDSALARDGLHETFAIEIPGGDHVAINISTAPIIYSKGAGVMRQVKGFIGESNFRDGLTRYLETHAYGNGSSHHLWEALEAVSELPVARMMRSWVEQPGYPLVSVRRENAELILKQERFTYLPGTSEQHWDIPVDILLFKKNGETQHLQTLLRETEKSVHLNEEPAAYKVNAGQYGFYRTFYRDADALLSLSRYMRRGDLPPEDRWGLQNDLYALVRSGRVGIDEYLRFLESYRSEKASLPLMSIGANLLQSYLLLKGPSRRNVASIGKSILENGLRVAGFEPGKDEPFTVSLMRDRVMHPAVLFGAESIAERARSAYLALAAKGETVHPDIYGAVLQVAALRGASEELDWMLDRFRRSEIEHERLNILSALGCFPSPAQIEKALQFALDEVPERNTFIPIVAMANNPAALKLMWDWYREHRGRLEKLHHLLYERIVAAIVPVVESEQAEEVKVFCEQYLEERPHMRDVIRLSLEKLEINLRFRENNQSLGKTSS